MVMESGVLVPVSVPEEAPACSCRPLPVISQPAKVATPPLAATGLAVQPSAAPGRAVSEC